MKKQVATGIALFLLSAPFARAFADGYGSAQPCTPTYGGGTNCAPAVTFTLTKEVQSPTKGGQFVKNLTLNDPRFAPGQTVNFRITIKNTGSQTINQLNMTDAFPQFLTFTSGVAGTYDASSRTLKFNINNLGAGQSQQVVAQAQFAAAQDLPSNQGITCVTNSINAVDTVSGASATDTSAACVEKNVNTTTPQIFKTVPLKQTPPTGPEDAVLPILGAAGLLGAYLRHRSK